MLQIMERVGNKAKSFSEAEAWEKQQYQRMTPDERMRAARQIKNRLYPGKQMDVRECRITKKTR